MYYLPKQTLGQQFSDHFPEGNLHVSDPTMLAIFWEILGHVKTCHPTSSCCWDIYGLRNPCYWDTGTNGDFEIFWYRNTVTNVNLEIFCYNHGTTSTFSFTGTNVRLDEKRLYIYLKCQPVSLTKMKVIFGSISFTEHCHGFTNLMTVR